MKEQIEQILAYLHGFWRYRWTALLVSWLVGLIAAITVLALPDKYQAKAVVYIDTTSVIKPLLKGLAVETDDAQEVNVVNRILLSRENLLSVIRKTDMDLNIHTPQEEENLILKLAKDITLQGGRRSKNIYEISYKAPSAQQAYKVVSVLMNTMVEKLLSSSRTDTAGAENFLTEQIQKYEKRLQAAEKRMADFKKKNVGMMPDEKGSYYARLQNAQDRADSIRSDLHLAMQRYSELKEQLSGEKPLIGMQTAGAAQKSQLQIYQEQLTSLLNKYTDQHPDVIALKATIAQLKRQAEKEAKGKGIEGAGNTTELNPVYQQLKLEVNKTSVLIGSLKLQLSEQQAKVSKLKSLIDAIPGVEAKLSKLNRDYEITKERYLALVNRRESARLSRVADQNSSELKIRIIEPPVIPVLPVGPNRPLLLTVALLAALASGLGWGILRYMINPAFIDANQLRQLLELPVLGSISYFATPSIKRRRRLQFNSFLLATFLLVIAYGGLMWKHEKGAQLIRSLIPISNLTGENIPNS